MSMPRRLGIDCLSMFGLPPVQFVTFGVQVSVNPENYPAYSLVDASTQREVKAALRSNGIALKSGEGFFFMPRNKAKHFAAHLDAMAQMGAETINMVSLNGDLERTLDEFAALAEMSAANGNVQLCDCRYQATDYMHESMYERLRPGPGELPLAALLAAAPRHVPVGIEVPQQSLADSGVGPLQRLQPCVAAARELLSKAEN
jgi:hypothetical protein